jgi:NhaP-type Na+/H+ or K+/H+ antiporter
MRYGLTGEAGLNDGAAFPFVIFALLWGEQGGAGEWIGPWALHRLVWAIPVALVLGYLLGQGVGRLSIWLRSHNQDTSAPSDFLALALIALAYVGAEYIGAWGFLAVFAAGVGLRSAEKLVVEESPHPDSDLASRKSADDDPTHPPAEVMVAAQVEPEELKEPAVAAGVVVAEILSFGDTAERLLEILLVVIVGVGLMMYWDWRALPLALVLFFVIRPLGTYLFLSWTPTTKMQRWLMGWFGIRGIGSLYYICYAINHGVSEDAATEVIKLTISVIALSVLIHGVSAKPILARYERKLKQTEAVPSAP